MGRRSARGPGGHHKGRFPRDEPGRKTGHREVALGGKDRVPRGKGRDTRGVLGSTGGWISLLSGLLFRQTGHRFGKNIPGIKINYVRMLSEINREEMDLPSLERIIKRDTYLSYALLNYINSAYFGLRESVGSIIQALALLGQREVRNGPPSSSSPLSARTSPRR